MSNREVLERLYGIAEAQSGCFTALQARSAGYSVQSQYYHVQCGDWERLARGIFRLHYFPRPERLDLLTYYLWTCDSSGTPQGVFSHDTALSIHPYSVWMPREKHITVPAAFRRRAQTPGKLRLYKGVLAAKDVCVVDGVKVTKPVRTLVDLVERGFTAQYHLVDFVRTSIASGVITDKDLREADLSEDEWKLVKPLFTAAGYSKANEIQKPRRVQART